MKRETLQRVAQEVDRMLNGVAGPKVNGFVILAFPLNKPEGARTNYVSNGKREDVLTALKEIVARFEGRVPETETRQ